MNHHADEPLYSEITTETPEKIQNTPVVFSPDAPEVPKAFSKLFSYRIDEIFAHYLENGIPLGETLLDLFSVCHVGRIVHRVQKCVRSIEIWSFLRLLEWKFNFEFNFETIFRLNFHNTFQFVWLLLTNCVYQIWHFRFRAIVPSFFYDIQWRHGITDSSSPYLIFLNFFPPRVR